jgi:lipoyltransferase 1
MNSKIMNLCEENPKIGIDKLMSAIGWEYLRTPVNSLKDGGKELANKQKGFQMINPSEQWFPGKNTSLIIPL